MVQCIVLMKSLYNTDYLKNYTLLRFTFSWQCVFNAVSLRYYSPKKHRAETSPDITTGIQNYICADKKKIKQTLTLSFFLNLRCYFTFSPRLVALKQSLIYTANSFRTLSTN